MKQYTRKTAMILALAGIFAAPALFAQTTDTAAPPPPPPDSAEHVQHMVQHHVAYLTTVLTLTTAQQTQITNLLTTAATNGKSANHAAMRTAHDSLRTAIHANDAAAMEQASTTIANFEAQETLARAKTEAAIYQLLTPEQQSKFSALETERGPAGHGGPHGGFGPGPGL
jgi:Spy/CpxP family protein refolding chaperone